LENVLEKLHSIIQSLIMCSNVFSRGVCAKDTPHAMPTRLLVHEALYVFQSTIGIRVMVNRYQLGGLLEAQLFMLRSILPKLGSDGDACHLSVYSKNDSSCTFHEPLAGLHIGLDFATAFRMVRSMPTTPSRTGTSIASAPS
jgi:hypothetical protein